MVTMGFHLALLGLARGSMVTSAVESPLIHPTGPPSLWFKRLPFTQAVGSSHPGQNLDYEMTAGQVGTGSAWKLYTCCAAATLVSGTRVAPGLHLGTLTGVKSNLH